MLPNSDSGDSADHGLGGGDDGASGGARESVAGYTVGPPNVTVDVKTMKIVGAGYEFRGFIQKAPKEDGEKGEKILTGIFQQKDC